MTPPNSLCDLLARMAKDSGLPPMAGRILGHLLFDDDFLSLDHLSVNIPASKASLSASLQHLDDLGIVERRRRGRRVEARLRPDAWQCLAARIHDTLIERGTMIIEHAQVMDDSAVGRRLEDLGEFHHNVAHQVSSLTITPGNRS